MKKITGPIQVGDVIHLGIGPKSEATVIRTYDGPTGEMLMDVDRPFDTLDGEGGIDHRFGLLATRAYYPVIRRP